LGSLERYFNRDYYKNIKQSDLGSLKMELPKKVILIFFKLGKLVEDYHLLLPSKPLEDDFCCLENIDF
jgi:hypothetical protein